MRGVTTIFLLHAWFRVTHQQDGSFLSKIKDIYGTNPLAEGSTEKSSASMPDGDNWCECPEELRAAGARRCVCVPHHYCDDNKVVDKRGKGVIDVRADEVRPCSPLSWCCSLGNEINATTVPRLSKLLGCGWRKPEGVGFPLKVNSDEAEFGEFPWMVAVLAYTRSIINESISYKCGGTLIHPKAVITAAHCVFYETLKYLIKAGEWNLRSVMEPYPSQLLEIKSIAIHPGFVRRGMLNNIAFLLLESPVDVSKPHVGIACLPQQGTVFSSGTRCFATGWGKDEFGVKGKDQSILRKIDLPIVGRSTCQKNLQTTRLSEYFRLHESFICAGGEAGKDLCTGAGGSPLVCPIPGFQNRYQQAGIVSWGIGCGDEGIPGVYADVARFRDWIDQEAIKNKLETSVYTY